MTYYTILRLLSKFTEDLERLMVNKLSPRSKIIVLLTNFMLVKSMMERLL